MSSSTKVESAKDRLGRDTGYKVDDDTMISALRQLRNGDELADSFETALRIMCGKDAGRRAYWTSKASRIREQVYKRVAKSFA